MFKSLGNYSLRLAANRLRTNRLLFLTSIHRASSTTRGSEPIDSIDDCLVNEATLTEDLSDDESMISRNASMFWQESAKKDLSQDVLQFFEEIEKKIKAIKQSNRYGNKRLPHQQIETITDCVKSFCQNKKTWSNDEIVIFEKSSVSFLKVIRTKNTQSYAYEFMDHVLQTLSAASSNIKKDLMAQFLIELIHEAHAIDYEKEVPEFLLEKFAFMMNPFLHEVLENPDNKPFDLFCAYLMLKGSKDSRIVSSIIQRFSQQTTDIMVFLEQIAFWNKFMALCSETEVSTHGSNLRRIQINVNITELLAPYNIVTMPEQNIFGLLNKLMELFEECSNDNHRDRKIIYRMKSNKRTIEQISFELAIRICNQILEHKETDNRFRFRMVIRMVKFTNKITSGYSVTLNPQFIDLIADNWDANVDNLVYSDYLEMLTTITTNIVNDNFNKLIQKVFKSYIDRLEEELNDPLSLENAKFCSYYGLNKLGKHFYTGTDYTKLIELVNVAIKDTDPLNHPYRFLALISVIQNLWDSFVTNEHVIEKIMECSTRILSGEKPYKPGTHFSFVRSMILLNSVISGEPKLSQYHEIAKENTTHLIKLMETTSVFEKIHKNIRVSESNIQVQIGSLFSRLGVEYESEKFVLFTKVDFFLKPNIIVEILGECHFYKGQIDNYSKHKKKAFQALGYRTFYCTDAFLKQHDNKLKLIAGIQKALKAAGVKIGSVEPKLANEKNSKQAEVADGNKKVVEPGVVRN